VGVVLEHPGRELESRLVPFEHLGLERWPFPVVPDRQFCTFIADRKQLNKDVNALVDTLARQDASSIHLLWSWFGAGKTHTLYYVANRSMATANSMGGRLHAVYSEFPKSPRTFLDVYRAFALGLSLGELVDAYMEISTSPDSPLFHREMLAASADLATALHVLTTGTPVDEALALRWLRGEALPVSEFRKIGIYKKLDSSEDASRVLAMIVRLFSTAARLQHRPAGRVLWLLDEFQRIESLRSSVRDEINTGLHSTFNACPSGLSMVLSFSGKPEANVPSWFSPELRDRIGRTRVIVLPPLRSDEALEFIRDVLYQSRSVNPPQPDPYFPFTESSCRFIIEDVARVAELKPRAIMQAFDAVLREADRDLQSHKLKTIDPRTAKRILAEAVSLSVTQDDTQ
jgi:hypothetical protein